MPNPPLQRWRADSFTRIWLSTDFVFSLRRAEATSGTTAGILEEEMRSPSDPRSSRSFMPPGVDARPCTSLIFPYFFPSWFVLISPKIESPSGRTGDFLVEFLSLLSTTLSLGKLAQPPSLLQTPPPMCSLLMIPPPSTARRSPPVFPRALAELWTYPEGSHLFHPLLFVFARCKLK